MGVSRHSPHNNPNTHGLRLKRLDRLDVLANVVRHRLEVAEDFLSLVYDSLVLQDRAVVCDIDGGGLGLQLCSNTLSVCVSFAECLQ